jgi:hypothetical protein
MKNCSAIFGLSDSIVSMSLRAHSKVVANRMAYFLSSVIGFSAKICGRGEGTTVYFLFQISQNCFTVAGPCPAVVVGECEKFSDALVQYEVPQHVCPIAQVIWPVDNRLVPSRCLFLDGLPTTSSGSNDNDISNQRLGIIQQGQRRCAWSAATRVVNDGLRVMD